jgi:Domain of unknown function (DUF1772)
MVGVVQILTLLAVAVTMALALAHALELPGKMRLSKEAYYEVQPIYYPGFTFAGFAEPVGILLTILLLFVTPLGTVAFWLTLAALAGLISVQAVYWLFTHPVNKFWLQDEKLSRAGSGFFSFAANTAQSRPASWTELRDRWEYSHVARAVLAFASFSALAIAISL